MLFWCEFPPEKPTTSHNHGRLSTSQEIEAENLRKINRVKWEEQIKTLEERGGCIKLSVEAVDSSGRSLGNPFTFKPAIYHQNKVESNARTHVSSALHLAVDNNDVPRRSV